MKGTVQRSTKTPQSLGDRHRDSHKNRTKRVQKKLLIFQIKKLRRRETQGTSLRDKLPGKAEAEIFDITNTCFREKDAVDERWETT